MKDPERLYNIKPQPKNLTNVLQRSVESATQSGRFKKSVKTVVNSPKRTLAQFGWVGYRMTGIGHVDTEYRWSISSIHYGSAEGRKTK